MNPAPPLVSLAQVTKMTYLYILQGVHNKAIYIGATSDLRQRVKAHGYGWSRSTQRYLPIRLIYYEAFRDAQDAWNREKQLKQFGGGYRNLMRRLQGSLGVSTKGGAG